MSILSPAKANHLFWLGRYAERIFAQLHFLRLYYDKCLDEGREDALLEYCGRLSLSDCTADRDLFLLGHLYGDAPGSIRFGLNCLNDNSILLREELTTASLGYVNLCLATLSHCEHRKTTNIVRLQPVSDYILAFWGSVLQHVSSLPVLDTLFIGRHIEYLDMYSRFGYPASRLRTEWTHLERRLNRMDFIVDKNSRDTITGIFADGGEVSERLPEMLEALNSLVRA